MWLKPWDFNGISGGLMWKILFLDGGLMWVAILDVAFLNI
jgi:hypothetical protein